MRRFSYTQKRILEEDAALRRETNAGPSQAAVLKRAAQLMVARMQLKELRPSQRLRAEKKAAQEKFRATAKGEWAKALEASQQQMLNSFLYRETLDATEEVEKLENLADGLNKRDTQAKLGKAAPEYRDAIRFLLGVFGLGEEVDGDWGLIDAAVGLMNDDLTPVGAWVEPLREVASTPVQDLSVAHMRHLYDALKNISHAATTRNTVILGEARAELEQVADGLQAEAITNRPNVIPLPSSEKAATLLQRFGGKLRSLDGTSLKIRTMVLWLGGGRLDSFWFRSIMKPMQDAKVKKNDLQKQHMEPAVQILKKMPREVRARWSEAIDGEKLFPSHSVRSGQAIAPPSKRFELVMMAYHSGTESSRTKLLEGRNISSDELDAALDLLTKEEWDFIQALWDTHEALGNEVSKLEERDSGLPLQRLEARPVQTRFGVYRGGYAPLSYDPRVEAAGEKEALSTQAAPFKPVPRTDRRFTKSRTDYVGAVSLEPSTILTGIDRVTHDLAFREPVKSVDKLLRISSVAATLKDRLGVERAKQFPLWLTDIATNSAGEVAQHAAVWMQMVRQIRANTVVGVLGYSGRNFLADMSSIGLSVAAGKVNPRHFATGLTAFMSAPLKSIQEVSKLSGEFRTQRQTVRNDLVKELDAFTASQKWPLKVLRWYRGGAFWLMEASYALTAAPVWMSVYGQHVEGGASETEAIAAADNVLSQVFPSHHPVDAAAITRDKGPIGMALLFHGFFNTRFNLTRDAVEARKWWTILAMGLVAGAWAELWSGRGPEAGDGDDDKERWLTWGGRKLVADLLAQIPFGGDFANLIEAEVMGKHSNPRNTSLAVAAGKAVISGVGLGKSALANDEDVGRDFVKFARDSMPFTGVPVSQPLNTFGYIKDVLEGETDVRNPFDILSGGIFGERDNQGDDPFRITSRAISGPKQ